MEVLWDGGDKSAKEISDILAKEIGWNKNTAYTEIKKCIAKGAIERSEPNFICHAAIDRETERRSETEELLNRLFGGSSDLLFASMISSGKLTKEQVETIIYAAILAPSWKNLQTSRYYCILSDEKIEEFRQKCLPEFNQKNAEGAALVVATFVKGCVGFDRLSGEPVNE